MPHTLAIRLVPLLALAACATPPQWTEGEALGAPWPAGARVVEYDSAIDGETQHAVFLPSTAATPAPLLVCLHTWSGDFRQTDPGAACARWCAEHGWAFVQPDARGANRRPQATGSEQAVADALAAVELACRAAPVDRARVYLFGSSGGGHLALLLAGRAPQRWAGVSAWVPITDLARWHVECAAAGRRYAKDLELSCGGVPGASAAVDGEYVHRSPMSWLARAAGVPIDINAGVRDGHDGSVPVGHSLRAFDLLAAPELRFGEVTINAIERSARVSDELRFGGEDPLYGARRPLLRRSYGAVRVTLFDGGHEAIVPAALTWLSWQTQRN